MHNNVQLALLSRSVSPCSILMAYLSIWLDMLAIRLMAFGDTVKGGLYMVYPVFYSVSYPDFIPTNTKEMEFTCLLLWALLSQQ